MENWRNVFKSHIRKAFKRVSIKSKSKISSPPPQASNLIDLRNQLVNSDGNKIEIDQLNEAISDIEAKINYDKITKHFQNYSEIPERINLQQVWKTMNKLWPKVKSKLPAAKKDHKGRLISEPKALQILLAKEYKERLRTRPVRPDLNDLEARKPRYFNLS